MNIKSLLLGSAAAMVAVSGARAADAIVIAPEPEPMEYVRVCDIYGTGYFYIPGTETCLKIGGYFRYEIRNINEDGYTKRARFAPTFTAKSETEWGTLTGYARVFFNWDYQGTTTTTYALDATGALVATNTTTFGYQNNTVLDHMQISLSNANGTLLIGKGDTPYARFLGYGGPTINDGNYGFNNSAEISYTFTAANGFSAILAVVEDNDADWAPDFEGGVNFTQGWGSLGAIAGYDESADNWGAKAVARFAVPSTPVNLSLHVFYSEDNGVAGTYTILDPAGAITEWSVLAGASVAVNEKVGLAATVQWFDTDEWAVAVGVPLSPVAGLSITPEITYNTVSEDVGGIIRFQRSF